jgi:hypothetical protein
MFFSEPASSYVFISNLAMLGAGRGGSWSDGLGEGLQLILPNTKTLGHARPING